MAAARPGPRGARRSAPERRWLAAALALLGLYLSPLVVLGEDAPVLIHDNLDSNLVWYRILAGSGLLFAPSDAIVPQLLGGVPRGAFGSELNAQLWLYVAFEPFTAYALNQLLLRLVALAGAFLLLRRHVIPSREPWAPLLHVGCALAFALLPFWPSAGLAVAGQPLALFAFLNVRAGSRRPADWAVVALLPFYGNLIVASVFFLAALVAFAAFDSVRARRLGGPLWAAIGLHAALLLAVEYRLLAALLSGGSFVSHRTGFRPALVPLRQAASFAWKLLVEGQYHAASAQRPVILGALGLATLLCLRARRLCRLLAGCGAAIGAIAAFYGLYRWQGFAGARELLSLGVGFAADRFYTLDPLLWTAVFAGSLRVVAQELPRGAVLAAGLLALQIAHVFLESEWADAARTHGISYRAFFAEEQFAAIREAIGLPPDAYRVVSLGLHPSVAQYNGFRTADGYFPNYPLAHKRALRRVMAHELERDPALARYFDDWGSRAYVFSAEIGRRFLPDGEAPGTLRRLRLDPDALRALDVRFVLSAQRIGDPAASGLVFRRAFTHPDSAWTVHLYERPDSEGSPP